uniref:Serine/threonine-protein phosphatase n=1 Tax=Eiseniibacteriota bacterium TaxID=2212470 RepID=A0A832I3P7_UNCEI
MSQAPDMMPPGAPRGAAEAGRRQVEVEIAALSDRGRAREANEDSFVVFRLGRYLEPLTSNIPESELPGRSEERGHVMIVADGVGGHEAGEVASRTTLLTALRLILRSPRWALSFHDPETRRREIDDMAARARAYLAGAQAEIRRRAEENPSQRGMGTTMTGAYAVGADLFVQHIGDSKAYLLRGGALEKITRDHTVAQQYADLGVIAQEEVATHRLQHVLTRAVGAGAHDAEADFHHVELADGDRLLLCSDGLTDMVSEPDIARLMGQAGTCDEACGALVRAALDAGGHDNVTVIVAAFSIA